MKKILLTVVACVSLSGCLSSSPYNNMDSWLIREDSVRKFVVPADVIYVQGDLYTRMARIPMMLEYAKSEVGNGRFIRLARVFSPLVATQDDLEEALKWYFWHHHDSERPFVFIGEGEGGRLLKEYEQRHVEKLKKDGLALSFYTDEYRKGFVTDEMVQEIRGAIARARYRAIWGREMPEDMLK